MQPCLGDRPAQSSALRTNRSARRHLDAIYLWRIIPHPRALHKSISCCPKCPVGNPPRRTFPPSSKSPSFRVSFHHPYSRTAFSNFHSPAPNKGNPSSVLVLLHGLGDTGAPFARFASQLNLPSTVCVAVQAPHPLPPLLGLSGFHWGDDILLEQGTGDVDPDAGFKAASRALLEDVIRRGLFEKCGYAARDVVLFGFGQGGMVALQVAAEMAVAKGGELGGVVSVGGALPAGAPLAKAEKDKKKSEKIKTPMLVCRAVRESAVSETAAAKIKDLFEFAEVKTWRRVGDAMPSNRDEMLPIMQFFAQRLRSRMGVPDGAVEIT